MNWYNTVIDSIDESSESEDEENDWLVLDHWNEENWSKIREPYSRKKDKSEKRGSTPKKKSKYM